MKTPKCVRCANTDDLIRDDGPVIVCRDCVELLGNIVADPTRCSEALLTALLETHSDVVKLARTAAPGHEIVWEWTA